MKTFIIKKRAFYVYGVAFLVLVWWISSQRIKNDFILPDISSVTSELLVMLTTKKTYVVLSRSLLGLLIALASSFLVSVILGSISLLSSKFRNFVQPIVSTVRSLPVAAVIILLLVVFGSTKTTLLITGFVVFPIMYESIYQSFKQVEPSLIDDVLTISKIDWSVIKHIYIPIAYPYILSSFVVSMGLGFKVMIMAEFIAQPQNTIGKEILFQREMLNTPAVMAWTILVIGLVLFLEFMVRRFNTVIKSESVIA